MLMRYASRPRASPTSLPTADEPEAQLEYDQKLLNKLLPTPLRGQKLEDLPEKLRDKMIERMHVATNGDED